MSRIITVVFFVPLVVAVVGVFAVFGHAFSPQARAANVPYGTAPESVLMSSPGNYDPVPVTLWGQSWRKRMPAAKH